ncbi:hypothetical protein CLOM_g9315 [Closterium sp. NIES-68]|nr:hypothetical protein CLOM_g9315 [Closterium sp. NIES-68]
MLCHALYQFRDSSLQFFAILLSLRHCPENSCFASCVCSRGTLANSRFPYSPSHITFACAVNRRLILTPIASLVVRHRANGDAIQRMDALVLSFAAGFCGQAAAVVVRLRPTLVFLERLLLALLEPQIGRRNTRVLLALDL